MLHDGHGVVAHSLPPKRRVRLVSWLAVAAAVLTLSGCTLPWVKRTCPHVSADVPPLTERELRADWEGRFGPLPACDHWEWVVVEPEVYATLCPANSAGCTTYSQQSATRYCPTTFTTEAHAHDRRLAAHEWTHATLYCVGKRDPDHTDPALWCPAGFVCNYPSP